MNAPSYKNRRAAGVTLIESMIAISVLAVAIPLVLGTIAESSKTAMSAEAETRASWIVPLCMNEVRASRDGKPEYFTATTIGQTFPSDGDVWALGFSDDGRPLGKIPKATYDKGTRELDGRPLRYIATMAAVKQSDSAMLRVDILVEYPASAPAAKRTKLDFHARIP